MPDLVKTPAERTGYAEPRIGNDLSAQLRSLQRYYTILDSGRAVVELLEGEPSLVPLLVEAVPHLQMAFGKSRVFHARVQRSDDESLLKVAVQLPRDFKGDPELALRSFDETWWLGNCGRSSGALVFDYEIQDAL